MTHDELLALLNAKSDSDEVHALCAVVELHKPRATIMGVGCCEPCSDKVFVPYPCPTIQAIEKELK